MSTVSFQDHLILGIDRGADLSEAKKRRRFLAVAFHPDRFPDSMRDMATKELQRINDAYDRFLKQGNFHDHPTETTGSEAARANASWNSTPQSESSGVRTSPNESRYQVHQATHTASCVSCHNIIIYGGYCMKHKDTGGLFHFWCIQ